MNKVITLGNCPECGHSDVRKLASVYSAGTGGVLSEKGESFSGTSASGVAIVADPPQKMANLTGWTLSMLLWPPIIWMFLFVAIQHLNGGPTWQETAAGSAALLSAAIVTLAAWSIPAWLQRRRAGRYNGEGWRPAMKHWREASVCLNCGKVYA